MNIRPIKTKRDYENAIKRIGALMHAPPYTDEGEELDDLATPPKTTLSYNEPGTSPKCS